MLQTSSCFNDPVYMLAICASVSQIHGQKRLSEFNDGESVLSNDLKPHFAAY